ncbi:MAG: hypothetical protein L0207_03530 [Chlamydiae bacterium]|nr:hypothetical protein [Chlamydiota bacterium]
MHKGFLSAIDSCPNDIWMQPLPFFIPLEGYALSSTPLEKIGQFCEAYLGILSPKKAVVIQKETIDYLNEKDKKNLTNIKSTFVKTVYREEPIIKKAFAAISYLLIVPPLLALIGKIYFRTNKDIQMVPAPISDVVEGIVENINNINPNVFKNNHHIETKDVPSKPTTQLAASLPDKNGRTWNYSKSFRYGRSSGYYPIFKLDLCKMDDQQYPVYLKGEELDVDLRGWKKIEIIYLSDEMQTKIKTAIDQKLAELNID